MSSQFFFREQMTVRFKTLLPVLLVGLAVLAGCGEDTSKRTLAFTAQPTDGAAGQALSSIQVTLRNGDGKPVTDAKGEVELSLYVGPEGATLDGTLRQPLSKGVATFEDVSVPKAGSGLVLKATYEGKEAVSSPFAVGHGAASKLEIVQGPSDATVGQPIAPSVQLRVVDAKGNLATAAAGELSVTIGDPASTGAQILGTRTATVSKGLATFANLTIDKAGDFTLKFTGANLTAAESAPFKVKPGKGTWLAFTSQPADATAGVALSTTRVEARDEYGNLDEGASGEVKMQLGNGNGASLSGTQKAAFVRGVATFSDLKVLKAGSGYTLEASSAQRVPASSQEFAITPAAVAKVEFTTSPSSAVAGVGFSPAPAVRATDAFGNATDGTVSIDLVSPPAGVTLQGTTQATTANGAATFAGLSLQKAGSYTLRATVGTSGPSATSGALAVAAAAAQHVTITAAPSSAVAGVAFSPAVAVATEDAFGNPADGTVRIELAEGPNGATLQGTAELTTSNGKATFTGLNLQKAGAYKLQSVVVGGDSATSGTLNVSAATAASVEFTTSPSSAVAGVGFTPAPVVRVTDAFGNATDGTVSIGLVSPPTGVTLQGTTQATTTGGEATFAGLSLQKTGNYTLRAKVGTNGPSAISGALAVAAGAAQSVTITAAPTAAVAGVAFSPAVAVATEDAFGNPADGTVRIELAEGPNGATLQGTAELTTSNGKVTFTGLNLQKAGAYKLRSVVVGGDSATSGTLNVSAADVAAVEFTASPSTAVAGQAFAPAVSVRVTDAFGNLTNGTVNLGLATAPASAVLQGTTQATTANGAATFAGLSLQKAGSYTLQATVGTSGPSATSGALTVAGAAAQHVTITAAPTAAVAGVAFSPAVAVATEDAFGNPASGTVRIELAEGPNGATLQGTTELTTSNGTVTFSGLNLQKVGAYKLRSVVVGGDSATGGAFSVTHAAPAQLTFVAQPAGGPANLTLSTAPVVEISDAFGNVASTATGNVTVALGNNPGSATLTGTQSVVVANGRATFPDLNVNKVGTGYTLVASLNAVATESAGFDVGASITAFVYTDPTQGDLRLVRNPSSTPTQLVLDLVAARALTGFGAGFNLPVDVSRARLATDGFVPGAALPPGRNPMAAKAGLPTSGPLQGMLVTAQSQKAEGAGAVPIDSTISAGTVLYTVKLDLAPGATPGTVFDGVNAPIAAFNGVLRTRAGVDVVSRNGFGIGRLIVIGP